MVSVPQTTWDHDKRPSRPSSCELLTDRSLRNWDLHVTSSCHRIKVYSINRSRPATAARLKQLEEKGLSITPITKPLEFDLESDEDWRANMIARDGRDPEE